MSKRDSGSGSIEQRSMGRWRVTVALQPDPVTGKRRRRRFTVHGTKRNAQAALIEALHERDHGGVDPDGVMTGEWLEHWIDRRVGGGAYAASPGPAAGSGLRATRRHRSHHAAALSRGVVARGIHPARQA